MSILEEVKGVSMAGVGWRLASSMGSACRWAMSSRGERAHTASQRAGERAVRSGACGEDGGAWAAVSASALLDVRVQNFQENTFGFG